MTQFGRKVNLRLVGLEGRATPSASLVFVGGNLRVFGDDTGNDIVVERNAANAVKVTVNADPFGSYTLTGNLEVKSGNGTDTVSLRFTNATPLPGNVTISTGNGDDTVNINTTAAATANGQINGRTVFDLGIGNDSIDVTESAGEAMTFAGLVTVNGGIGEDEFDAESIAGEPIAFASSVILSGTDTIEFNGVSTAKVTVAGSIHRSFGPDAAIVSYMEIDNSIVGGHVTFIGGSARDEFTLDDSVLNGDVTVMAGEGENEFDFDDLVEVNGNITFVGGNGDDEFDIGGAAGTVIAGNVTAVMGHGDNSYELLGEANAVISIGGDFAVTAGNGEDDLGDVITAVGGSLTLNLGNGDNNVSLLGDLGASIGNRFDYTGGSGGDEIEIFGTNTFAFTALLGAGVDTVTIDAAASVGSMNLDYGVDLDTGETLASPLITWPSTVLNLD